MKITRSTYFLIFAAFLLAASATIREFSLSLAKQVFLPIILVVIILAVIGAIVAIKDKEFVKVISDERTKKVDRSSGYYSWWFSVLFIYVFGVLAEFEDFTPLQTISVILLEMFLTLILLHMYFNFKGKE